MNPISFPITNFTVQEKNSVCLCIRDFNAAQQAIPQPCNTVPKMWKHAKYYFICLNINFKLSACIYRVI